MTNEICRVFGDGPRCGERERNGDGVCSGLDLHSEIRKWLKQEGDTGTTFWRWGGRQLSGKLEEECSR